jgi:hypothetical protein
MHLTCIPCCLCTPPQNTSPHLHKQSYKARGIQLILTNPSPRVVRLMERSGLIGKIGRDWIFVRVHDAVRGLACC